jgi:hypothetical protein
MAEPEKDAQHQQRSSGYEERDVNIGRIALIGIVCVILLAISLFLVDQYFIITKEKDIQEIVLKPQSVTLREVRSREDEILNSYKLIDSSKGIYQIPISRAMEILAQNTYHIQSDGKSGTIKR